MGVFPCLWLCFFNVIINLIIFFGMKRGYGGVLGYIEKCVGFVGMLFDSSKKCQKYISEKVVEQKIVKIFIPIMLFYGNKNVCLGFM